MLDGERIDPAKSHYAQAILARIQAKGTGQVLYRSELFSGVLGVEYFDDHKMRLEPDWVLLCIACLVYAGEVVLAIPGYAPLGDHGAGYPCQDRRRSDGQSRFHAWQRRQQAPLRRRVRCDT